MNIHEYQAKELIASYGVEVQKGKVAGNEIDAVNYAHDLFEKGSEVVVVKAQIHAGGRGKAGGVKVCTSTKEVQDVTRSMIGTHLVTPQTSKKGKQVHQVLIAEDVYYKGVHEPKEYYISILVDRSREKNVIIYSKQGGVNIEEVSATNPSEIYKQWIDADIGIQAYQLRNIAFNLGLKGRVHKHMMAFIDKLYNCFVSSDATLVEINPCLKTSDEKIVAVDCKIKLDKNALFRHPNLLEYKDLREQDPIEVEAGAFGLNYINLDGNVGCMVNGAGLAMATMDIIQQAGGRPANFLDVGGAADAQRVENGFRIILEDVQVRAILVNIFGGIVRCDRVAKGIVQAYENIGNIGVPIIVRLEGTHAEEAKHIIENSNLEVRYVGSLEEVKHAIAEVV